MAAESNPSTVLDALADSVNNAVKNAVGKLKDDLLKELTNPTKRASNNDVTEKITKKLKQNEVPEFKRKVNKNQFEHNNKVKQALLDVEEALDEGEYEEAKEHLTKGKTIIEKRQKLIRIADREDDGWR